MFDKLAAALSVVALGAASFAVYKTSAPQVAPAGGISEAAIEAYLKENPEVLVASLENYERTAREKQRREQAEADIELIASNKDEIFKDGYSLVAGNPDGDLTVVEFSDYNCGYCKRAHGEVAKFIENDGNIRLVLKEFPILGPGSVTAGRAALASAMQDGGEKYVEFNDELMKHRGSHNEASVMKIAESVGLDVDQLKEDMKSSEVDAQVKKTYALAEKLKINGTPAFIIGNQVVRGFVPAEQLQELAKSARASG